MPRFFVEKGNIFPDHIFITGEDVKHIRNVLRMKKGEEIVLCDGSGKDYIGIVEEFESDRIRAFVREVKKSRTEPSVEVTLFQGIPKSDRMDFIIQKSVELGVNQIIPVITERTIVRFNSQKDMDKKAGRWQKISLEAAKQCNRGIIPRVGSPLSFDDALKVCKEADLSIIPYEKHTGHGLKEYLYGNNAERICVFIGPEGGFSEEEMKKAVSSGIKLVTLGPRILRTETAAIAVLSIIIYEAGDIEK